jgi:hypothetical protein
MKRMIFSGFIVLVLASMVIVGYAEMQKIAISEGNLADLKGKWTGSRTLGPGTALNTDLEISSNSLPVQGKFIFYNVRRPGKSGTTETEDFKDGKINDKGNLLITSSNVYVELSLYKDDGKMKLDGDFSWGPAKGTMSFKKK